jgi:uncharacterized membrane protein
VNKVNQKLGLINGLRWLTVSVLMLVFSVGISWKIAVEINFGYSVWYDTLEIDQAISKFAPQNNFGKGSFEFTNKKQHVLLFGQIVNSVTDSTNQLEDITYVTFDGKQVALLTESEIIHLRDVGVLVDNLTVVWGIGVLLLLLLKVCLRNSTYKSPTAIFKLIFISLLLLGTVTLFFLNGFVTIFYYLHTLVFPDNHQWFFYYQDSLMSTLMKAPDLFEVIGAMLLTIAILIYYLIKRLFEFIGLDKKPM